MTAVSSCTFYTEQVHDVTVVAFTIPALVDTTYESVSDDLFELVEYIVTSGPIQVVLDLQSVKQIDDWGLAMLRAFHETIDDHNGLVMLCRMHQRVCSAIHEAGLANMLHQCETLNEAIQSFE